MKPDQVRVAVVQYADQVKTEFSLKTHNNKPDVISAIKRLRQIGGRSSDLANAINYIIQNELKPSAGARLTEASQHLVVLTGGRSSQDVSLYGPLLKGSRVNCVGIGTAAADKRQLTQIATTTEDVLQVPAFHGLPTIKERLFARIKQTLPEEPPTIVENGKLYKMCKSFTQGHFLDLRKLTIATLSDFNVFSFLTLLYIVLFCVCFSHLMMTDLPPKKADIVFLLDGSINLGQENFKEVLSFITNLIDLFFTDKDDPRIGFAHYAADVTDVFYLNTHKNKQDIISAIEQTEYKGGNKINTGAAIRHVQNVHFTKDKGSRMDKGTPQILMVITGGRSADDSKTAALGLKNKGVRVFAVGVGDIENELENLASETSTVARAANFQGLSELNEQILETLDDEMKGKLCAGAKEVPKGRRYSIIDYYTLLYSLVLSLLISLHFLIIHIQNVFCDFQKA